MKAKHWILVLIGLAAAGAAGAQVSVAIDKAQVFTGMPQAPAERKRLLDEIGAHFAKLGASLPPGESLHIEIRDVDMAGRFEPRRFGDEVRVLRGGADWPTLDLHYVLESNGTVLANADAHLASMDYLQQINRYPPGDELRYEKQMIDDWFGATFKPRHPPLAANGR